MGKELEATVPPAENRISMGEKINCIGSSCIYFSGEECEARTGLVDKISRDSQVPPKIKSTRYAEYDIICRGMGEDITVGKQGTTPNRKTKPAKLLKLFNQDRDAELGL